MVIVTIEFVIVYSSTHTCTCTTRCTFLSCDNHCMSLVGKVWIGVFEGGLWGGRSFGLQEFQVCMNVIGNGNAEDLGVNWEKCQAFRDVVVPGLWSRGYNRSFVLPIRDRKRVTCAYSFYYRDCSGNRGMC